MPFDGEVEAGKIIKGPGGQDGALQGVKKRSSDLIGLAGKRQLPRFSSLGQGFRQPALVVPVETPDLGDDLVRQGVKLDGQHAPEAHSSAVGEGVAKDVAVKFQALPGIPTLLVDLGKKPGHDGTVPDEQFPSEIRLFGKVIVDARCLDADAIGQVAKAERVVSRRLHQLEGDVEDFVTSMRACHNGRLYAARPGGERGIPSQAGGLTNDIDEMDESRCNSSQPLLNTSA